MMKSVLFWILHTLANKYAGDLLANIVERILGATPEIMQRLSRGLKGVANLFVKWSSQAEDHFCIRKALVTHIQEDPSAACLCTRRASRFYNAHIIEKTQGKSRTRKSNWIFNYSIWTNFKRVLDYSSLYSALSATSKNAVPPPSTPPGRRRYLSKPFGV